jgi:propanol-preferring alcohol dehydrogenase
MADAGTTAYKAVTHNVCSLLSLDCVVNPPCVQVKAGDRVLIYGVGGLGFLAVQFAKHVGATVYAVDIKPSSRAIALQFGAEKAFDVQELQRAVGEVFTVDVAIDFVANDLCALNLRSEAKRADHSCFPLTAFNLNFSAVKRNLQNTGKGGKIVMVGASGANLQYTSMDFITAEVSGKQSIKILLYHDTQRSMQSLHPCTDPRKTWRWY